MLLEGFIRSKLNQTRELRMTRIVFQPASRHMEPIPEEKGQVPRAFAPSEVSAFALPLLDGKEEFRCCFG
jgi:hypothetical protein